MTAAVLDARALNVSAIRAELGRRSLAEFVKQSWHVLEPTTPLLWNWHLDAMCDHIQATLEDWMKATDAAKREETYVQRIRDLLINVPPGSAKSRVLCVCAVAWMWLLCPSWQVICLTANPTALLRDALLTRLLIESDWYQRTFRPSWELSEDQNAKSNFRNTAGGSRIAISVGARITALRADALFVDDPHDAKEVLSDAMREGVLEWWDNAASNRLNDPSRSVRIGIMQRLHENDWAGHVLATGTFEHLCIKQEFTPGQLKLRPIMKPDGGRSLQWVDETTAIGFRDPRTDEGQLMFPKRFSQQVVSAEKRKPAGFYSGQHQQDPMAAGGNKFKKDWFRYYIIDGDDYVLRAKQGIRRVPKRSCKRFTTGDFAFSIKQTADYTVLATWDVTPTGDLILVDLRRSRMEDPDVERAVEAVWDELHPVYIGIENKQNGATILQRLSRKGRVRVKPIEADTDKITRSVPAQVDMEAGKYFFPDGAEFLLEYEAELLRFPTGQHDDQVDVTSYAAIEKSTAMPRLTDWGNVTILGRQ